MLENFNWVDYVVIAIFFLSLIAGLMRGFVKEVIGLITWVAAFVIAALFAARLAAAFTGSQSVQTALVHSSGNMGQSLSAVSIGISFVCIFVVVLIIGKVISYLISGAVEGYGISFTNRFLGGLFGLARGFLLVILTMFLVDLTSFSNENAWRESVFVNYFKPIVQSVGNVVQPGLENLKSKVERTLQGANQSSFSEDSDVIR